MCAEKTAIQHGLDAILATSFLSLGYLLLLNPYSDVALSLPFVAGILTSAIVRIVK